MFARLAKFIGNKKTLSDDSKCIEALTEITMDESMSHEIVEAAKKSMGADISQIDLVNIEMFAVRVISLAEYRKVL